MKKKTVKKVTTVIAASAVAASNIKEAKIQLEAARCASCNCMTYFYCAPLQVYTPFRSAQNHCPPDNVRPAGGYISWESSPS